MVINGKNYKIPELSFNAMCTLEEMGVSLTSMDKKILSTVRGFLALAMGGDLDRAGKEMEEHLAAGGGLDDMMTEINKAVESSGFFRALNKTTPKKTQSSKSAQSKEES